MQTAEHKRLIAAEAFRLLRSGGRYGIYELAIVPDDMPACQRRVIDRVLSSAIHVGARPLPALEWRLSLEDVGFRVVAIGYAPMHLLRPLRLISGRGHSRDFEACKESDGQNVARRRSLGYALGIRALWTEFVRNLHCRTKGLATGRRDTCRRLLRTGVSHHAAKRS